MKTKMVKQARTFSGTAPKDGVLVAENEQWAIYDRLRPSGKWSAIKIVSKKPRAIKANYWLGWDGERFAKNRDYRLLAANRPEVARWAEQLLA